MIEKYEAQALIEAKALGKEYDVQPVLRRSDLGTKTGIAAIETVWLAFKGDWVEIKRVVDETLGEEAKDASKWIQAAIKQASELSDAQ